MYLEKGVILQVDDEAIIGTKYFSASNGEGGDLKFHLVFCLQTILPVVCDQSEPTSLASKTAFFPTNSK